LKVYSKAEEDRRSRLHDKVEKATSDWAIDTKTRLLLYKMINNFVLEKVYGMVSTGKESVILYATGGVLPADSKLQIVIPKECALKVFKTSLNEFKNRDKYIKNDYRFKDRFSKQNPRKTIHLWAEKELHNLARMNKAGILCPKAVLLKKHILVLEFIGTEMKPAPKLKDVKFPDDDDDNVLLTSAYHQTVEAMKKMYDDCNLIHADLSEFNILWYENKCYLIDVSQAVEPTHDNALEFLYRDCVNICTFFGKRGLENIRSPESLFTHVCGLELTEDTGPAIINQIRDYERNIERLTFGCTDKAYPFEHAWEQTQH
jgi:RIO kinase 3